MKIYNNKLYAILSLLLLFLSCNEQDFLSEEPLDFFDPSNSFATMENLESSLADIYAKYRDIYFDGGFSNYNHFMGTDIMFNSRGSEDAARFGNYIAALDPTSGIPEYHWDRWYKIIANVNTIIAKLNDSEIAIEERTSVEAEARLFRALAYRHLVYLFGGVPLITEEISSPKTDFTRASKDEILEQIVVDATFATSNLPGISEVVDGKLSNLVAQHLLAETYISLGNFDAAITAASQVIDDPATDLMKNRFGSRSAESGDVYWDLFRRENQNRSSGNTEAIWVSQMEVDLPGGYITTTSSNTNNLERFHVPASWTLNDPDGNIGILGWRGDANTGGRGVSFVQPTAFFENTLWESDFDNDLRNSEANYVRDIFYDNPESAWFGQSARDNPGSLYLGEGQSWRWYPWLTKATTPNNHPADIYDDPELLLLKSSGGTTYRDRYYLRLSETYLLRAEAYLGKNDLGNAAADINTVRERSNANPVTAGEVDIDYILDERARELSFEEMRRITLHRTGKLVERVRLYNDLNTDDIADYHGLWPIPAKEIEANINGNLEQNPGY
ncbi:RagB/SusD family nutrient uptake outer membrane protein [uncultured Kriegella sp.]|uniref:RagB/SusD family nutrient uptake outer membrane protein n=1 Tax=uncultured Kriegella sp. TaxID=1798910 RepID=UPI0030D96A54|tara:strand:- start:34479 stop:36155 length:1677 start_codon:yes stop_codon:yes gene_type:complete